MSGASRHNGYLDLLKFIFALGVLGVHTYLFGMDFRLVYCGHLAVDFFLMVSGYFTAKEAMEARMQKTPDALSKYFVKRIKKIYPPFFAATIYGFVIMEWLKRASFTTVFDDLYKNVFDFIPLQIQGFPSMCATNVQWYIGALFVATPILYALVLRFGNSFSVVFAPIISAFLFGIIQTQIGALADVVAPIGGVFLAGMVRAMADMILGSTIFAISVKMKSLTLTKRGFITIRCIRVFLLCTAIRLCFIPFSGYGDFVFVCVIFAFLALLFAFPVRERIFSCRIFRELGKISSTLFLVHVPTGFMLRALAPDLPIPVRVVLYYVVSILVSFLLYYLVEIARREHFLKRFFIKTT